MSNTVAWTAGVVACPAQVAVVLDIHEHMSPEAIVRAWEEGRYNRAISALMATERTAASNVVSLDDMRQKAYAGAAKVKGESRGHDLELNREALAKGPTRAEKGVRPTPNKGGWRPRLVWLMWGGMACWRCQEFHKHINAERDTGLVLGHLLPRSHPQSNNGVTNLAVVCRACDKLMDVQDWTGRIPSVKDMIDNGLLKLTGPHGTWHMKRIPASLRVVL